MRRKGRISKIWILFDSFNGVVEILQNLCIVLQGSLLECSFIFFKGRLLVFGKGLGVDSVSPEEVIQIFYEVLERRAEKFCDTLPLHVSLESKVGLFIGQSVSRSRVFPLSEYLRKRGYESTRTFINVEDPERDIKERFQVIKVIMRPGTTRSHFSPAGKNIY